MPCERRGGGQTASELGSRSSDPGLSRRRDHCVVFSTRILCLSPPRSINDTGELLEKPNEMLGG